MFLQRESFISCTVINHRYYRSSHAFDSRGNKRKTKPQRVFMMEHGAYICLYFKPCSGTLVVRVNAHVFWLITLPLYHFSPSPCIYALPQQLLCSFSQRSLLPLSISLARSINTMRILAVSLRGDFAPPWLLCRDRGMTWQLWNMAKQSRVYFTPFQLQDYRGICI